MALAPRISRRDSLRRLAAGVAGFTAASAGSQGVQGAQVAQVAQLRLTMIHAFKGEAAGAYPASLCFRSDGSLFGVAEAGGRQNRGLVFAIGRSGRFQVVHRFGPGEAQAGGAGSGVLSPLAEGPDGWMYGATSNGGNWGKGLAYRLDELGRVVQLHHFTGSETDGQSPSHRFLPLADGDLLGSSLRVSGGWNLAPQLYRLKPDGSVIQLAQVGSGLNGMAQPAVGLDGQVYLMTASGGSTGRGGAYRTSTTPNETAFAELIHDVASPLPRMQASGGFLPWADGALYGTSENDPLDLGWGTVFRMDMTGQVHPLHRFNGADGGRPFGLVLGPDGAMYGVARVGGPLGFGAVYRVMPGQGVHIVYAFEEWSAPVGQLALGPDGRLYGCTTFGPQGGFFGSVYALSPA